MPNVVIIQIVARVPNPTLPNEVLESTIMQIECKRPSLDTAASWRNTIYGQFLDDLEATGNPSKRLYGAVAIGKKVRFYRFDGRAQDMLFQLHPDTLDLGSTSDFPRVEQMMNHIKENGWQWARS